MSDKIERNEEAFDQTMLVEAAARRTELERELAGVLNRFSEENRSNTPDFILAQYLLHCLDAFHASVKERSRWYSCDVSPAGECHRNTGRVPADVTGQPTAEPVEEFAVKLPSGPVKMPSPKVVTSVDRCDCELRNRRWNPNTGRCEYCRRAFEVPSSMLAERVPPATRQTRAVLDMDNCYIPEDAEMGGGRWILVDISSPGQQRCFMPLQVCQLPSGQVVADSNPDLPLEGFLVPLQIKHRIWTSLPVIFQKKDRPITDPSDPRAWTRR